MSLFTSTLCPFRPPLWRSVITVSTVAIYPSLRQCSPYGCWLFTRWLWPWVRTSLFPTSRDAEAPPIWGCSALHCSDWCPFDHDLGTWLPLFAGQEYPLRFLVGSPPWPSRFYRFCPLSLTTVAALDGFQPRLVIPRATVPASSWVTSIAWVILF